MKKLEPEFYDEILNKYNDGKSTFELGKEYGVNPNTIYYRLKKLGVKPRGRSRAQRVYDIVEDFFDVIDTQEKAYFLGFLYADGCNSTELACVRIVLTEQDVDALNKLSRLVYKDYRPLLKRKGSWFEDKGKMYKRKDSYCLTISNQHISRKLESYGLVKAKSMKVEFPTCVPENLLWHFVRGYFDGDGCLSFTSGQIAISILGTESFTNQLREKLLDRNVKSSVCHAKNGSVLKQLVIHGNRVGIRFLNFIYHDSTIHMERKHQKFKKIISLLESRDTC